MIRDRAFGQWNFFCIFHRDMLHQMAAVIFSVPGRKEHKRALVGEVSTQWKRRKIADINLPEKRQGVPGYLAAWPVQSRADNRKTPDEACVRRLRWTEGRVKNDPGARSLFDMRLELWRWQGGKTCLLVIREWDRCRGPESVSVLKFCGARVLRVRSVMRPMSDEATDGEVQANDTLERLIAISGGETNHRYRVLEGGKAVGILHMTDLVKALVPRVSGSVAD